MSKVFICYRREDSAYPAHQICGELKNHFGSESVVFDVDDIPLSADFREYLNEQVSKCDILLAAFCILVPLPITASANSLTGKVVKITDGDTTI